MIAVRTSAGTRRGHKSVTTVRHHITEDGYIWAIERQGSGLHVCKYASLFAAETSVCARAPFFLLQVYKCLLFQTRRRPKLHRDEREILAGSRAEYWIFQKVNKRGLIIKVNKYSLPLKLFQDFQFSTFRAALSLFTALCWRTHTHMHTHTLVLCLIWSPKRGAKKKKLPITQRQLY